MLHVGKHVTVLHVTCGETQLHVGKPRGARDLCKVIQGTRGPRPPVWGLRHLPKGYSPWARLPEGQGGRRESQLASTANVLIANYKCGLECPA